MGNPLRGRIGGESEVSVGPSVAGVTGFFFSAGTCVGCIPAWLLVMRTLGARDLVRVPLWGLLRASIPCSRSPLSGAAAWLGAGGEVGACDGMFAKVLSFVGRVLRRPQNVVGAEEAIIALCERRETSWLLEGGPASWWGYVIREGTLCRLLQDYPS